MTGLSTLERDGHVLRPRQTGIELQLEFSGSAENEALSILPGHFGLLRDEVVRSDTTLVVALHRMSMANVSVEDWSGGET